MTDDDPGSIPPPLGGPRRRGAGRLPPPAAGPPPRPEPGGASAASGGGPVCEICGSEPATEVTFRQGVGFLFARQVRTIDGSYCRDCGRALGREVANRTLFTGWWGISAFFFNIGYALGNAGALTKLSRLRPPDGGRGRLDSGRPLALRGGIAFVGAAVLVVGLVIAASGASSEPEYGDGGGSYGDAPAWEIGACVSIIGSVVSPTDCDGLEDGQVLDEVYDQADCPYATDSYVEDALSVYCIDED